MGSSRDANLQEDKFEENESIAKMALYSLARARTTLSNLSHHPSWTDADTSSFDCMHYDGNLALERCASRIGIQPSQHILDIGSGFSATGRFLVSKYHVKVTGVELQRDIHELAQLITARNVERGVVEGVRSVNADFLTLEPRMLGVADVKFDHAVSFLCIMHMSQASRQPLFQQVARYLKPGGKVYLEDFYRRAQLTEEDSFKLRTVLACPYLPTRMDYITDVADAGFKDLEFEDVSEHWKCLLVNRAEGYKTSEEHSVDLQVFYDTVTEIFMRGNVGGVRLIAVRV